MNTIFITIISLILAIIGLILGNWLSLIPNWLLLWIWLRFNPPANGPQTALIFMYFSRASMGFMVGLLFGFFAHFGLNNFILTATFLFWAIFMSEPPLISNSAQILSHDILRDDIERYFYHKIGLKIARVIAYFIAKFGLFVGIIYLS